MFFVPLFRNMSVIAKDWTAKANISFKGVPAERHNKARRLQLWYTINKLEFLLVSFLGYNNSPLLYFAHMGGVDFFSFFFNLSTIQSSTSSLLYLDLQISFSFFAFFAFLYQVGKSLEGLIHCSRFPKPTGRKALSTPLNLFFLFF